MPNSDLAAAARELRPLRQEFLKGPLCLVMGVETECVEYVGSPVGSTDKSSDQKVQTAASLEAAQEAFAQFSSETLLEPVTLLRKPQTIGRLYRVESEDRGRMGTFEVQDAYSPLAVLSAGGVEVCVEALRRLAAKSEQGVSSGRVEPHFAIYQTKFWGDDYRIKVYLGSPEAPVMLDGTDAGFTEIPANDYKTADLAGLDAAGTDDWAKGLMRDWLRGVASSQPGGISHEGMTQTDREIREAVAGTARVALETFFAYTPADENEFAWRQERSFTPSEWAVVRAAAAAVGSDLVQADELSLYLHGVLDDGGTLDLDCTPPDSAELPQGGLWKANAENTPFVDGFLAKVADAAPGAFLYLRGSGPVAETQAAAAAVSDVPSRKRRRR